MNGSLNEKARLSVPISLAWTVVVSAVTGAIGATATAYGLRDQMLEKLHAEMNRSLQLTREEREAKLKYYLDKETWSEWKQAQQAKADYRYFSLQNSIERLQGKIDRR